MYATLTSFTRHTHSSQISLCVPSHPPSSLAGLCFSIEVSIDRCAAENTPVCNTHMTCHMMRTENAFSPLPRH